MNRRYVPELLSRFIYLCTVPGIHGYGMQVITARLRLILARLFVAAALMILSFFFYHVPVGRADVEDDDASPALNCGNSR